MIVAVTSQGTDLSSLIDIRFDLARYFIVLNTVSGEFTAHDNSQNRNGSRRAAIHAGESVVGMGVDAVITCSVDPEAFTALRAGNVKVHVGATGSVRKAVEQFEAGQLSRALNPNVESHLT